MSSLGVAEAAERLGLSWRRVVAMIAAGRLPAHRVGNSWAIEASDVARHRPLLGRPMSPRVARGLLLLAAGNTTRLLRSWLSNRAERIAYELPDDDFARLRADQRIAAAGLSHPASRIHSLNIVEGYVVRSDLKSIEAENFLVPGASSAGSPNVILHVSEQKLPMSLLLIAADLADHRGPREDAQVSPVVLDWAAEPNLLISSRTQS